MDASEVTTLIETIVEQRMGAIQATMVAEVGTRFQAMEAMLAQLLQQQQPNPLGSSGGVAHPEHPCSSSEQAEAGVAEGSAEEDPEYHLLRHGAQRGANSRVMRA